VGRRGRETPRQGRCGRSPVTYPGTQHGFNNDTTPRYDKAAADLAWRRTMAFFEPTLRG